MVVSTRKEAWPASGDKLHSNKRHIFSVPMVRMENRVDAVLEKDRLPTRSSRVYLVSSGQDGAYGHFTSTLDPFSAFHRASNRNVVPTMVENTMGNIVGPKFAASSRCKFKAFPNRAVRVTVPFMPMIAAAADEPWRSFDESGEYFIFRPGYVLWTVAAKEAKASLR